MGGNQSAPAPPPPTIVEDPYPAVTGADGISLSQAVKCADCQLGVDTNVSVASVKLTRELGDIQASQCTAYSTDKARVKNRFMSLADFLFNLQSGKYARGTADETITVPGGSRTQSYCEMLSISDEEAAKITNIDEVDAKLKGGRIRKVSGSGGYSSGTKARFVPSIPFKMSFSGNKVVMGADGKRQFRPFTSEFTVSQMTIYHPSPIRVDGVQADAVLSLNDASDPNATSIVLIPLKGTNDSEGAAGFINKLTNKLPVINTYDMQSGTYPEATVQTGADWTLGSLFTLDKEPGKGGTASVKNGFFTWTGVSGYERIRIDQAYFSAGILDAVRRRDEAAMQRVTSEFANWRASNTIRYSWKPIDGLASPQYYLLDSPLAVNLTDLSLITSSLDPTPPSEAIHPIPAQPELVFHKGSVPPAPDTITGSQGCGGITNVCEGFTTGTLNDQLSQSDDFEKSCPGAKCDPFLQNVKQLKSGTFTTTALFSAIFGALTILAMVVGAYVAMTLVNEDYDLGLRTFSESLGKILAVWAKGTRDRLPSMTAPQPDVSNLLSGIKIPEGISNLLKSKAQ